MKSLPEIIQDNELVDTTNQTRNTSNHDRDNSLCVHTNLGGQILGVVLHSGRYRDTKYVDFGSDFKRRYFDLVCTRHGVEPWAVLTDTDGIKPAIINQIVAHYWSGEHYPLY